MPLKWPRYRSSLVTPVAHVIIIHKLLHLVIPHLLLRNAVPVSSSARLIQLPIHHLPPSRPESPHSPNDDTTRRGNHTNSRKQPPVTNRTDQRLGNDSSHAREDVPHKVVHGDAVGCLFGHELREHGRRHGEDEHRADAEEEIRDQGHEPEDALFDGPAVPDQGGGIEEGGDPGVLAHAVFGSVHQLALFVVAAGTLGFPRHDGIRPSAAEEGSEDVADGVGNVGQADDVGGEVVGRLGEGCLQRDVEEV